LSIRSAPDRACAAEARHVDRQLDHRIPAVDARRCSRVGAASATHGLLDVVEALARHGRQGCVGLDRRFSRAELRI
jgi:hypothetical protein